jgi:hypothetical protein
MPSWRSGRSVTIVSFPPPFQAHEAAHKAAETIRGLRGSFDGQFVCNARPDQQLLRRLEVGVGQGLPAAEPLESLRRRLLAKEVARLCLESLQIDVADRWEIVGGLVTGLVDEVGEYDRLLGPVDVVDNVAQVTTHNLHLGQTASRSLWRTRPRWRLPRTRVCAAPFSYGAAASERSAAISCSAGASSPSAQLGTIHARRRCWDAIAAASARKAARDCVGDGPSAPSAAVGRSASGSARNASTARSTSEHQADAVSGASNRRRTMSWRAHVAATYQGRCRSRRRSSRSFRVAVRRDAEHLSGDGSSLPPLGEGIHDHARAAESEPARTCRAHPPDRPYRHSRETAGPR